MILLPLLLLCFHHEMVTASPLNLWLRLLEDYKESPVFPAKASCTSLQSANLLTYENI